MLNLSDKELDRFSQEAAQEYEPGEVLGPRSWDRLEVRINQEFGSPGWNPIRHIRKWPFFYAPVMLVLLGVIYYLVRPGSSSGSSPGAMAKVPTGKVPAAAVAPVSTSKNSVQDQNTVSTDKATSTLPSSANPSGSAAASTASAASASSAGSAASSGSNASVVTAAGAKASTSSASSAASSGSKASGVNAANAKAPASSATAAGGSVRAASGNAVRGENAVRPGSAAAGGNEAAENAAAGGSVVKRGSVARAANAGRGASGAGRETSGRGQSASGAERGANGAGSGVRSGLGERGTDRGRRGLSGGIGGIAGSTARTADNVGKSDNAGAQTYGTTGEVAAANAVAQNREISQVAVQRPGSLSKRTAVNDSALRAYNAKSPIPSPIKKKGVYQINRKWQFGLMAAPDFTSVNSLAGDKAGSSIGLTLDYNFASHWYISTGILSTRKNYAARTQDYHAPHDFYMQNGINSAGLNFVKGSFYMMEIPLNLRYDFLTSGNTLFFATGGVSSYFMTTENANFYWRRFNQDECNPVDHVKVHPTSLISCLNLSAGVETGLSNSMSLVIAPYMKLPTKNLGVGQVQMNSVGIDFIIKWSPISSRKRD